jgi:hypothetical protein
MTRLSVLESAAPEFVAGGRHGGDVGAVATFGVEPGGHCLGNAFGLFGVEMEFAAEGAQFLREVVKFDACCVEALGQRAAGGVELFELVGLAEQGAEPGGDAVVAREAVLQAAAEAGEFLGAVQAGKITLEGRYGVLGEVEGVEFGQLGLDEGGLLGGEPGFAGQPGALGEQVAPSLVGRVVGGELGFVAREEVE